MDSVVIANAINIYIIIKEKVKYKFLVHRSNKTIIIKAYIFVFEIVIILQDFNKIVFILTKY